MDDPRHVVLAASRKNTGGELHHSLKIRVDAEQQQHHRHPRGAGDGADAEETSMVAPPRTAAVVEVGTTTRGW